MKHCPGEMNPKIQSAESTNKNSLKLQIIKVQNVSNIKCINLETFIKC